FTADAEAGFVQVFDRRFDYFITHGCGETLEPVGRILADPRYRRGGQIDAEQVRHQLRQTFLRQQLVMQQVKHEGADPFAVLHRGGDVFGEGRLRLLAASLANAGVGAVLGDHDGLGFRQVEDLTRVEARRCRLIQRSAASAAGLRKMVDGGVGVFGSAQRLTGMALLSARLFAGRFAQASRARGFLVQSVAGRRFAAVAAVQAKAAFQFSDAGSERRDDLPLRAVLFQQCRDDLAKRRRLAGRCAIIGVGMRIGRWKRHRELDSCPESRVKRRSAARYLGCYLFFRVRPIVLSLAFSTMFNSTTFSSSRRRLQRANPSGAGEQVRAINLASAAPSKIRGRAEFGLYLRFSVASNPSSTSCCRVRETVLMLVSSAAEIALSLHPSPPSDTSAFSRMRALVSSCAELLPARINAS